MLWEEMHMLLKPTLSNWFNTFSKDTKQLANCTTLLHVAVTSMHFCAYEMKYQDNV